MTTGRKRVGRTGSEGKKRAKCESESVSAEKRRDWAVSVACSFGAGGPEESETEVWLIAETDGRERPTTNW